MDRRPSSPASEWKVAVAVREDADLSRTLSERLPPSTAPRAVSVTELIALRRAYWRALASIPLPPSRQARVEVGRALHAQLGVALASEGALEVRVRSDGVVGRIDLLADVPVEVKSTSSGVPPGELTESRPDQVEQLAMYCALAGRPTGRLLTLTVGQSTPGSVQAVDITFGDTEPIRAEMRRRADALRRAWADTRPRDLPACRWFGRGCEFQEAGVCDCTGAEAAPDSVILSQITGIADRTDVSSRIESRLGELPSPPELPTLVRFRDLLYPRRAYFERTAVATAPVRPRRSPSEPPDLYARLTTAIESGPLGEVARLPPRLPEPEEVVGFRGAPYLVRTSRGSSRARAETLLETQPQYALELGFRSVATGASVAHLFLGRERATVDADRVQAFEFRFEPASVFSRLWRERVRLLEVAFASQDPSALPACPEWMYPNCPYRADCGCAATGTRSQR